MMKREGKEFERRNKIYLHDLLQCIYCIIIEVLLLLNRSKEEETRR